MGLAGYCSAEPSCETSKAKTRTFGLISKTVCENGRETVKESVNLNGQPVLSDVQFFQEELGFDGSVRVYTSGAPSPLTGCAPRLYLLDMRHKPAKVFSFGIKNACNEFSWASWGDKRSVIG